MADTSLAEKSTEELEELLDQVTDLIEMKESDHAGGESFAEEQEASFIDYQLTGSISDRSIVPVIQKILEVNRREELPKYILLRIDSMGGDISESFKLIDIMQASRVPVITLALGEVASAAFLIFISGTFRIASPRSMFMMHHMKLTAKEIESDVNDLRAFVEAFDMNTKLMIDMVAENSNLSTSQVKKRIIRDEKDVWLNSKMMLEYGLIDGTLAQYPGVLWGEFEGNEEVELPDNVVALKTGTGE